MLSTCSMVLCPSLTGNSNDITYKEVNLVLTVYQTVLETACCYPETVNADDFVRFSSSLSEKSTHKSVVAGSEEASYANVWYSCHCCISVKRRNTYTVVV